MGKKDLDRFIERKARLKEEVQQIDWEKVKDEWLEYVSQFYRNIKNWLKDYEKQGVVTYKFAPAEIFEENIGQYKTDKMILTITNEQVVFEPVGTLLIGGAKGRIDMKGKYGTVKFVLIEEEARVPIRVQINNDDDEQKKQETDDKPLKLQWKIATPPPSVTHIDLNADSFSDCLLDLIND